MDLRPLGRTGLSVSPIGLGTVRLGRSKGLKLAAVGGAPVALPTDDQALALLRAAADSGVNLIDTAPADLMSRQGWFGRRDRWVVSTKAGEEFDDSEGVSRFDFSPSAITTSVERSLKRLRTTTLDIVLLHSDGQDQWVLEGSGAMDALRRLKAQGKVRCIGASTKTPDGGLFAVRHSGAECDVVMVAYNPRDRADSPVIEAARFRGVGVLVKKPLAGGHMDQVASLLPEQFSPIKDPVEASICFVLAKPGVSSAVIGTINPDHLRATAAAANRQSTP